MNQRWGVPVMPMAASLSRRMVWEMVSNAAVRSRRMRIEREPVSAARRRSLVILMRAVSVLWWGRKPDWNFSKRLLWERWEWSCDATVFSRILDRNGRLEMGRRLLKSCGSAFGFLRMGEMAADFKDEGNIPEEREEWMMVVMSGAREGRHALTRAEGRGSRWQVEGLDLEIREATSVMEGNVKEVRGWDQVRAGRAGRGLVAEGLDSSLWILEVFILKKDSRELQKLSERGREARGSGGRVSLLTRENSDLVWFALDVMSPV